MVERTTRALAYARVGEGVLFGVAAAFALVASAVSSGAERTDRGVWVLAGLGFVLAAVAWRLEHRKGAQQIARALDQRLRFAGALFTAYEIEERAGAVGAIGRVEQLVRDRVLARLRPAEALRAMFPPLLLPIAAPVLTAGMLVLTLEEARPEEAVDVDVAELSKEMVAAVGSLGSDALNAREDGTLAPQDAEELLDVWNRIKGMDRRLAQGRRIDGLDRQRALEELETIEDSLARLVGRMEEDPELRARLETARNFLEAVRSGLAAKGGVRADSGGREDLPGADSQSPNALASTGRAPEGTIQGSSSPSGVPNEAPTGTDPPPAHTSENRTRSRGTTSELVGAGRFWPESYDRLVTGWVEARERALEESDE